MQTSTPSSPLLSHVFSNIKPIRATLGEKDGYHGQGLASLFPYVPWGSKTKVAAENGQESFVTTRLASIDTSSRYRSLEQILKFPPLFKVFEDFCRQALCSEVGAFTTAPIRPYLTGILHLSTTHMAIKGIEL